MSKMFDVVTMTWSPYKGCRHGCYNGGRWAFRLATGKLKGTPKYKDGFEPGFFPKALKRKFRAGSFVFVCDMGDLFGEWVPAEWIQKVIDATAKPKNLKSKFLFLTKNPARYHEFVFPPNAFLGATIETNRCHYRVSRAPSPYSRYSSMAKLRFLNKFVSVEPILDFDMGIFVERLRDVGPVMVYVGYDNYKCRLPEPSLEKTRRLIRELSRFTQVREKSLRESWRENE